MDSEWKIGSIDELTIDAELQRIYFYDFYITVAQLFTDSKTAREVPLLLRCLAGFGSRRAQPVLATFIVRAVCEGLYAAIIASIMPRIYRD